MQPRSGDTFACASVYECGPLQQGAAWEQEVHAAPHGRWLTPTFVAGLQENVIIAPLVADSAMSGEIFRSCCRLSPRAMWS